MLEGKCGTRLEDVDVVAVAGLVSAAQAEARGIGHALVGTDEEQVLHRVRIARTHVQVDERRVAVLPAQPPKFQCNPFYFYLRNRFVAMPTSSFVLCIEGVLFFSRYFSTEEIVLIQLEMDLIPLHYYLFTVNRLKKNLTFVIAPKNVVLVSCRFLVNSPSFLRKIS